ATVRYALTVAYSGIGRARRKLSDRRGALDAFRQGVGLGQKLVADHPAVSLYQQGLCTDYNDLALVLLESGQSREGLATLQKSVPLREQLVARHPGVPDFASYLARGLTNLANYTADPEKADAYQRRAESLLRDLTARHPKEATYQATLAQSIYS